MFLSFDCCLLMFVCHVLLLCCVVFLRVECLCFTCLSVDVCRLFVSDVLFVFLCVFVLCACSLFVRSLVVVC